MDNPAQEPISNKPEALSMDQAASALSNIAGGTDEEMLAQKAAELDAGDAEPQDEPDTQDSAKITVDVDGKRVELTPEQVAEAYKSGLRQSDYSRKTAELAQERAAYAQRLTHYEIQLQGALQEQSQINWSHLLETNPVEYLKQQHLFQQRQAALQQAQHERAQIQHVQQHEYAHALHHHVTREQQTLVEKIPAWKDQGKAKAEKAEIRAYLKEHGIPEQDISQIVDHRHVIIARKAMQMDKLLQQAPNATKRVAKAPAKAERPGTAERGERKSYKKTGSLSIEDAAAALTSLM
jgi:hypothetical protein